ncbi:MAG: hypothetical protein IT211_04080 [Armatimonadetes bacterium]|nr:hypothetical protein [Armatimonadota bacterium]
MNVRVNNLHVVVYEHFHSSPNIIAGLCSGNQGSINEANYIDYSNSSSGGRGNVIAGGGATSGNSLRTGGGGGNLMYGLSSGGPVHFSAISGGLAHTIVSRVADGVIMGGEGNIIEYVPIYPTSDSIGATVMGGLQNWVHSVVGGITGGGERHQVGGVSTLYYRCGILSGREMTAYYLDNSVIAGGYSHTMHGNAAARSSGIFVGGGIEHQSYVIANSGGVILGGGRNSFFGNSRDSLRAYMAICGGHDNEIDLGVVTPTSAGSSVAFIGGGGENFVGHTPDYPTISGGFGNSLIEQTSYLGFRLNTYLPHYSAIPGGRALSIRQKGTFGFNGSTTVADVVIQPYTNANGLGLRIPIPTASVFTDVNILLGNVDGTTRELVFAEPNTSKTYSGTHFTSFRAQAQTADVNYTLPAALGTGGSDYILRDLSGTGSLTWQSASSVASSGAWGISGNAISSGGVSGQFIGTTAGNTEPFVLATNATERMRITSTGAIVTQHDTAVGIRMNATATSGTASITKRGLEILSTGQWDGATSTNIGLRSTVSGGATNIAARFLGAPLESEQQINFIGTAWNGTSGNYLGTISANRTTFATTSATPQPIIFFTGSNGATERMRVSASGEIGIGTTTTSWPLEVVNSGAIISDATVLRVQTTATSGTSNIIKTALDLQSTGTWNGTSAINIGVNTATSGASTNYPALFVAGRVGIGYSHTTTPAEDWLLLNAQSGAKTASFTATQIQNTATSATDGLIKIGLDITSTGTWNGTSARNIGLRSDVSGGATNIAAQFLGGSITTNSRVIFTGTPWNGTAGNFLGTTTTQPLVLATTSATAQPIQFFTGGSEQMRISENGEVGIGITNPSWVMDVAGNGAKTAAFTAARVNNTTTATTASIDKTALDIQSTGTWDDGSAATTESNIGINIAATSGQNNYDGIFTGGTVGIGTTTPGTRLSVVESGARAIAVNRTGSDGVLVEFFRSGASVGDITVATGTVSYNAFTGSHYAIADQPIEKGTLVSMTEHNKHGQGLPSSEIIYGIAPTSKANDPAVLGAYLSVREPGQVSNTTNPSLVMAVGNGEMWVTNVGGDIHAGDYLISSSVTGHAMRDAGMFDTSYVVARAAENVNWDDVEPDPTLDGAKRKKITVFFENFIKMNNRILPYQAAQLAKKIATQQERIKKLQDYISKIK